MDSWRYTASARLGLWDSLPGNREGFIQSLDQLLESNAHGVIEADSIIPTNDPALASVTAVCDKIVTRGNPTLIDLDFERALLDTSELNFLRAKEITEGPAVGMRLPSQPAFSTNDLIQAAEELLCRPYRSCRAGFADSPVLPPELRELSSPEEDRFLEQFIAAFSDRIRERIHRQVQIGDLVEEAADDIAQGRVDFVFQLGQLNWVFEIDGDQHMEPGQKALDERRDALLKSCGWRVHRVSAHDVRSDLGEWFDQLKTIADKHEPPVFAEAVRNPIQDAAAKSQIHSAAFTCILVPLAVHRCLRGLLQLYRHGVLDSERQQRILVLEEDIPATAEAFRMLHAIWSRIRTLAPSMPSAPRVQLEVLGDELVPGIPDVPDIDLRIVADPDGAYDVVLSHSFLLAEGYVGVSEKAVLPDYPANVRIRRAIGFRAERGLQWCEPLNYELADVERTILTQNSESPQPMPSDKHDALCFFLRLVFRKRDYWDGQLQVISRLLQGKHSIVLLPTGGGKSLTYQLSGLMLPGMTIIIDPLISLMNDQTENLRATGIDLAGSISSQLDSAARNAIMRNMGSGRLAFIFVSPERLQIQEFRNQLQLIVSEFPVSLAVIDEAHCVSEWGHDFRPSYLHMPRNLQHFCSDRNGGTPTLVGLTGTASFAVLTDMQIEMDITDEEAIILPRSFDRPELRFDVRRVPMRGKPTELKSLKRQLPRTLRSNTQRFYGIQGDSTNSGIVFCPHVNGPLGVASVAEDLGHSDYFAGKKPGLFVGDWGAHKAQVQKDFKRNRIQELVATKSFGMGIDKPNIRYTCHYTVPQSVEAFYQEAGRAGRNGTHGYALCTILYSDDNWTSALEILNEPDHQQALRKLNGINRKDRGDLLVQLWLLFNSYKGREEDKQRTVDFLLKQLGGTIGDMSPGATNTTEIGFNRREDDERAIYRLMLLGIVKDYTINWNKKHFEITVQRITPDEVRKNLRKYLLNYKFDDFVDRMVKGIPTDRLSNALKAAINVLIDFIYDEIVVKRKQALRTMGELCRSFTSDEDFREKILAYLQESEFSDELRKWVNREFDEIGVESIHDLLQKVTTLEEVKRLVGATRRILDEDPQNVALRYLSMCARAQSAAESDASVIQEADALAVQIEVSRENIRNPDSLFISMLEDIDARGSALLEKISDITLRRAGTASLARRVLRSKLASVPIIHSHSVKLLTAEAIRASEGIQLL